MSEQEWRQRYATRIMEATKMSREDADECAKAADYEADESPEDSAHMEMSYWESDDPENTP